MKNLIKAKVQTFTKDKLPEWVFDRAEKALEAEIEQLIAKKVTPKFIVEIQLEEWSKAEAGEPPAPTPTTPEGKSKSGKSSS